MSRLLDDLLDVSRVTQNKIDLQMRPVDLRSIVENAIDATQPLIQAGDLRFSDDTPDEPIIVLGDAARLQQAVSNLLANAAKYTPTGGNVSLAVRLEGDEVALVVQDSGVGIPHDKLNTIFDLFVQSDDTLHRCDGGMGIGLTLVRSIIEMHNGRVEAHSDGLGQGSRFEIRLPRRALTVGDESTMGSGERSGAGVNQWERWARRRR